MGNCTSKPSKKAKLREVNEKYAVAVSSLSGRERDLNDAHGELEASKARENDASRELSTLRARTQELSAQNDSLDRERQTHIAKLQAELKQKSEEVLAQQRAADSKSQELGEARRLLSQLVERARVSSEGFDQRQREFEAASAARDTELSQLTDRAKSLEQSNKSLTEELSSMKISAAEELSKTKVNAATELFIAKCSATRLLSETTAKLSKEDSKSRKELADVSSDLAVTKGFLKETTRALTAANDELASAKSALKEITNSLTAANGELAFTKSILEETTESLAAANEELASSRAEVAASSSHRNERSTAVGRRISYSDDWVKFSRSAYKDIRVRVQRWQGEVRVDIREHYEYGPTKKGISFPVRDIQMLEGILPDIVREAEAEEGYRR